MPVAVPEAPANTPFTFSFSNINLDRNWNVILHNDDHVYYQTVIDAIIEVVGHSEQKAKEIMQLANDTGKASVVITTETLAKHYQEQLQGYGLTITIEKLD